MVVFPLLAAGVSALFAALLFAQFRRRRRLPQLAWGLALSQYAIASLAVAAGIGGGWDPTLYRVFWLFGALLNVPWLALGSIALLGKRGVSIATLALVAIGTVWGVVAVAKAQINDRALLTRQIPAGRDVLMIAGSSPRSYDPARGLARVYSLPSFAIVVGIAALSGRRREGVRPPIERVRANWIIAAGVTLNAIGGFALVSKGRGGPFSVVLAASVITMFGGFVMASRSSMAARMLGQEAG
ncbi:MAG: hypothetical protein ACRDJM_01980 [Actinomycetota bacterium]